MAVDPHSSSWLAPWRCDQRSVRGLQGRRKRGMAQCQLMSCPMTKGFCPGCWKHRSDTARVQLADNFQRQIALQQRCSLPRTHGLARQSLADCFDWIVVAKQGRHVAAAPDPERLPLSVGAQGGAKSAIAGAMQPRDAVIDQHLDQVDCCAPCRMIPGLRPQFSVGRTCPRCCQGLPSRSQVRALLGSNVMRKHKYICCA